MRLTCRVRAITAQDSSVSTSACVRAPNRVKCFPAAVERPRACKSDAAARLSDMQHGTEHARVRSRVPPVRPPIRPPVSMPSGIVRRAAEARVHYQRPSSKSLSRYSHTHIHHASRIGYRSVARSTHTYEMDRVHCAIDEIISAAGNRVIGTFRETQDIYFAQRVDGSYCRYVFFTLRGRLAFRWELSSLNMQQPSLRYNMRFILYCATLVEYGTDTGDFPAFRLSFCVLRRRQKFICGIYIYFTEINLY